MEGGSGNWVNVGRNKEEAVHTVLKKEKRMEASKTLNWRDKCLRRNENQGLNDILSFPPLQTHCCIPVKGSQYHCGVLV